MRGAGFRAYAAEGLGTFALVFIGVGAVTANSITGHPGHLGIALSFGLVVAGVVYLFGPVSGAHINPAVTLALAFAGRFPRRRVPGYLLAQSLGALLAAGLLRASLGPATAAGATRATIAVAPAFFLEIMLTLFLMMVILAVVVSPQGRQVSGLAIGGAVFTGALWAGPLTGASMNPARTLGPALVAGDLSQLWLYMIGPVVGALLAVALFAAIRGEVSVPRSSGLRRLSPLTRILPAGTLLSRNLLSRTARSARQLRPGGARESLVVLEEGRHRGPMGL